MTTDATFADVRICVLDDNRNFQNLMRTLLRSMGFRRVDVFADPIAARAFVVETPCDLAFIDLVMPGISGIEWVRTVRRSAMLANPTMPIALVTGHADRRVLDAAVNAGVDDLLVKPLSPATLHRHTMRLLHHPVPYVRGVNGYFGPNLRGVHTNGFAAALNDRRDGGDARIDRGRRFSRSVPGLHVELRSRPVYGGEQTFLD